MLVQWLLLSASSQCTEIDSRPFAVLVLEADHQLSEYFWGDAMFWLFCSVATCMMCRKQAVMQASATPAVSSQESAPLQQAISKTGHGKHASKAQASSPTSSTTRRQPLNAIQNSIAVQSPISMTNSAHEPAQGSFNNSLEATQEISFPAAHPSLSDKASTSVVDVISADHGTHNPSASGPTRHGTDDGAEHAVPAAPQGPLSAAACSSLVFHYLDAAKPVAGSMGLSMACSGLPTQSAASGTHAAQSPEVQLTSVRTHSSGKMPLAAPAADNLRASPSHSTAASQLRDPAAQLAESATVAAQPSCSIAAEPDLHHCTASTAETPHGPGKATTDVAKDFASIPSAANTASTAVAAHAAPEAPKVSKPKGLSKGHKQAKAKGPTVEVSPADTLTNSRNDLCNFCVSCRAFNLEPNNCACCLGLSITHVHGRSLAVCIVCICKSHVLHKLSKVACTCS